MQWRSFGSSDEPDPALVEASLDADAENALPIAQPRTPAGNATRARRWRRLRGNQPVRRIPRVDGVNARRKILISTQVVVASVIGDHSRPHPEPAGGPAVRRRRSSCGREGAIEGRVEGASARAAGPRGAGHARGRPRGGAVHGGRAAGRRGSLSDEEAFGRNRRGIDVIHSANSLICIDSTASRRWRAGVTPTACWFRISSRTRAPAQDSRIDCFWAPVPLLLPGPVPVRLAFRTAFSLLVSYMPLAWANRARPGTFARIRSYRQHRSARFLALFKNKRARRPSAAPLLPQRSASSIPQGFVLHQVATARMLNSIAREDQEDAAPPPPPLNSGHHQSHEAK